MPELMDRVLVSREGDVFLSQFVNSFTSIPQSNDEVAASALIADSFSSSILMWLNDIANPKEKAIYANFVADLRKFSLTIKRRQSFGECLASYWKKTFAAKDRVKEIQLKLERDISTRILGNGEESRPGRSLKNLLKKTASSLKQSQAELLRGNAVERLLKEILEEANCECVVLVPVAKMADGQEVPRLVVASKIYGGVEDRALIQQVTGWECEEGTPAGLCKTSRALVNVENLIADLRFPLLNYKTLGMKAICQISQLVIPVFEGGSLGGGADNVKIDDGSNLIAIIKLVNKVSYNAEKSGLPFQTKDAIMGRCYSGMMVEALTMNYGAESSTFMSKLLKAKNREMARKLLSNVVEDKKAAIFVQSSFRGHQHRRDAATKKPLWTLV